jgi:hypothetical protein
VSAPEHPSLAEDPASSKLLNGEEVVPYRPADCFPVKVGTVKERIRYL